MLVGRYTIRASPLEPPVFATPLSGTEMLDVVSDPFRGSPLADGRRFASTDLVPLVPCVPSKVIAVARNYRSHANEFQNPIPDEPILFLKPPSALLDPEHAIRLPDVGRVDFEGELVLVIGRRIRNVDRHEAQAAILGVTCGNDVSARDLQKRDGQWGRAKGFDTFAPTGPTIALGADLSSGLTLVTRVNGDERQRCNTNEMIFGALDLVVFASTVMTLEPGDLIFTGTPAGVGPLSDGDVVEVEVEGVGVLRNPVVKV